MDHSRNLKSIETDILLQKMSAREMELRVAEEKEQEIMRKHQESIEMSESMNCQLKKVLKLEGYE